MLAYYFYPFVRNNRECIPYSEADLLKEEKVIELFDYCQILEAYIIFEGWVYLIEKHGWEKLYQLDRESGWFDVESIEEYRACVKSEMEMLKQIEEK